MENFLVIGLGKSGISVANYLNNHNKNVFAYDDDKQLAKELLLNKIVNEKTKILTKLSKKALFLIQCIILSPGIKLSPQRMKLIKKLNIPIISELAFAQKISKGKTLAITGTNGKTTTVNFLNQILDYAKVNNFLLGNVGTPFSQELDNITSNDKVLLEVSSFQLEYAFDLKIPCTAFLNITPDHLDRYKNFDEYFQTKCKLLDFTTQLMILNYDDPYLKNLQPNFKNIQYFSTQPLPKDYNGIYLDQNFIHLQKNKKSKPILDISNLALIGEHNIQNLMCAVLFALNEKIELSCLQSAINNLTLPKFRLEFVDSINGVDYYNDSKSTNSHSCLVATQCFKKPTWLLLGGSNKGEDFTNLIANLPSNIKTVVTFGQTGKKLFKLAKKFNLKTINFPHLINAFDYASANAKAGEIILLSPACASFDEFANYYDRGEFFNNLVSELKLER